MNRMNYKEAMASIDELTTLSILILSPDARWDTVQDWLRANPQWDELVDHYLTASPDHAVEDLKEFIHDYTEIPQVLIDLAITPEISARTRLAVETLQTLYRERQNYQTEKEIKNAGTKRTAKVGPKSRKPKRASEDRD